MKWSILVVVLKVDIESLAMEISTALSLILTLILFNLVNIVFKGFL